MCTSTNLLDTETTHIVHCAVHGDLMLLRSKLLLETFDLEGVFVARGGYALVSSEFVPR